VLGAAIPDRMTSFEDLGLELAPRWQKNRNGDDVGEVGHGSHGCEPIRPVATIGLFISRALRTRRCHNPRRGTQWPIVDPQNHYAGMVYQPKHIASIRRDLNRLDHQIREGNPKWARSQKDDARGRTLPEHMQAAIRWGTSENEPYLSLARLPTRSAARYVGCKPHWLSCRCVYAIASWATYRSGLIDASARTTSLPCAMRYRSRSDSLIVRCERGTGCLVRGTSREPESDPSIVFELQVILLLKYVVDAIHS